jgi:hypothetical protein
MATRGPSPKQRLETFLNAFDPAVAKTARAVLRVMRKRMPHAIEAVYDNYNALAIGFWPTDRASDGIFSIAVFPRWVTLFFLQGVGLDDPTKRLKGSGSKVRHIVLDDGVATLDEPDVRGLMTAAIASARVPFDPAQKHRLDIKSVSATQRDRRPSAAPARPAKRAKPRKR